MDYKGGRHLTVEQRDIIEEFERNRKQSLKKRMDDFFKTNDVFEQTQIITYVKNNFSLYILSVMYLYEDSLIYSGFNELTENEKYQRFLFFYNYKIKKEKLNFLSDYKLITGTSLDNEIYSCFITYEQNILNLLNAVKISNKNFKYTY